MILNNLVSRFDSRYWYWCYGKEGNDMNIVECNFKACVENLKQRERKNCQIVDNLYSA